METKKYLIFNFDSLNIDCICKDEWTFGASYFAFSRQASHPTWLKMRDVFFLKSALFQNQNCHVPPPCIFLHSAVRCDFQLALKRIMVYFYHLFYYLFLFNINLDIADCTHKLFKYFKTSTHLVVRKIFRRI